jgi:hypothetical protein
MLTMMVHWSWCNLPQWWVLHQLFLNKNTSDVSSAAFMRCIHAIVHCGAYHKICGSALLSLSSAAMIIKSRNKIITLIAIIKLRNFYYRSIKIIKLMIIKKKTTMEHKLYFSIVWDIFLVWDTIFVSNARGCCDFPPNACTYIFYQDSLVFTDATQVTILATSCLRWNSHCIVIDLAV